MLTGLIGLVVVAVVAVAVEVVLVVVIIGVLQVLPSSGVLLLLFVCSVALLYKGSRSYFSLLPTSLFEHQTLGQAVNRPTHRSTLSA